MKSFSKQIVSREEPVKNAVLSEEFVGDLLEYGSVEVLKNSTHQEESNELEKIRVRKSLAEIREKVESSGLQGKNKYFESLQKELSEDPKTKQLYDAIILNEDVNVLRKKTNEQVKKLSKIFFRSPALFHWRHNLVQKRKLKAFTEYVEALKPIRNDEGKYDEFKSPELTGNVSSYGGLDPLVNAERYVYASFDKMTHQMSGKLGVSPNTVELSNDDFENRAQIVMSDIVNVPSRAFQQGKGLMDTYLTNLFDYEGGKKILSLYLALVFDDPKDVEYTFDGNSSHLAQLWDEDDDFSKLGNDYDLLRGKTSKETREILETVIPEKRRKFFLGG